PVAEPAARIFSSVMGTEVRAHQDDAIFPTHSSLSVKAPDVVKTKFYVPIFEYAERFCNILKIFQNGLVSMYILYILVTLVLLLLWGIA
ncbi:MAG: hypothetical protein MJ061_06690, partial [Mailhella sp.]|nr:hypothetical protein [Mailhella sp.]